MVNRHERFSRYFEFSCFFFTLSSAHPLLGITHIYRTDQSDIDLLVEFSARKPLNAFPQMSTNSWDTYLLFSLWHLAKALQRLGSGQRSRGDWPFLLRMVKSAPFAARKQAMDAALFFSAPWVPKPIINCKVSDRKRRKKIKSETHSRGG